jgi:hypothetical protein
MSLLVHQSPFNFFDTFIADCYRQMAAEMDKIRDQMFQLMPSDFPPLAQEPDMLVPIIEESGERKMKMQFNVKDYKPEEVKVKVLGNDVLQVNLPLLNSFTCVRIDLLCGVLCKLELDRKRWLTST